MEKNILYERKIYVEDFLDICRSCLSKTNTIIRIEKDTLDLLKIIPDYEINLDDDLPSQICRDCISKLKDISLFIRIVKNNDRYLKEILKENKDKSNINQNTPIHYLNEYCQNDNSDDCLIEATDKLNNSEDTQLDIPGYFNTNVCDTKKDKSSEQTSTKGPLLKCNECDKKFTKQCNLKLHLRSHTKENPHECKICLKKFRYVQNLKRHENVNHKGSKPFECETCGKKFATLIRKTEHIRIHTGERPYVCNMCGLTFKKYSTYYTHEKRHKIKNGLIPKSDTIAKKYPKKIPDPSQLQCQICQRILSSKQALFVHKKKHSGEKSFLCTACGKGFVRKSHLEVHSRIHTGEKPYKCADCDKHFRQLAVYRNHLLIHKNKRSFKCEICQKSFIQLGHLQNHLKTHTGEKPYKCTFCNKAFAQNGNLRAHTRIHTNERPYSCTICYLEFYDSSSLKKHKKSHNSVDNKSEIVITNQ